MTATTVSTSPQVLVETDVLARIRRHVDVIVRTDQMMIVAGQSGAGKTTAVQDAADLALRNHPDLRVVRFSVPVNPSPKTFVRGLLRETINEPIDGTLDMLEHRLEAELAERSTLIVVDEAQHLRAHGVERIRFVWENMAHSIVFVGDGRMHKSLEQSPQLTSRIFSTTEIELLSGDELYAFLRELDPLAATISNQDLLTVDRRAAHGNLRRWGHFFTWLHYVRSKCGFTGPVDADQIKAALTELG